MLDIYDLRIMMEGLSAKLCVQNIDAETINKLGENVLLQEMYLSQNDTKKIWELDDKFHAAIHAASGNRLLQKMLDDFHHYTKFVRKYSYDTEGRSEASVREHKEIYLAIKDRNAEMAEKLMSNHVMQVKKNIIALGY
jgi:DNA-binding GntR family transcriptional regulator